MVNEKFREGVPVFEGLTLDPLKFEVFFKAVVKISERYEVSLCNKINESLVKQYVIYIHFLVNTFRSLEDPVVRNSTLRYFSLPMWSCLSEARLSEELEKYPQINRHWLYLQSQAKVDIPPTTAPSSSSSSSAKKRKAASDTAITAIVSTAVTTDTSDNIWVHGLLQMYINTIEEISLKDLKTFRTKALLPVMRYIERFSEFLVDLLSQLPTRRFLNTLLDDMHILIRCRRSAIYSHPEYKLFSQLITMVDEFMHFEVHDQTGVAMTAQDIMTNTNTKIHKLQTLAFTNFNKILKDLIFSSAGELSKSEILKKHFQILTTKQLIDIGTRLGRISSKDIELFNTTNNIDDDNDDSMAVKKSVLLSPVEFLEDSLLRSYVMDVLLDLLSVRKNQLDSLNRLSLYPTEELLWDPFQVPYGNTYTNDYPLALPKLNLQFLTIHDYLLRNFILYRLESAYEIREDLIDAIKRMGPKTGLKGNTLFGGWARMALPIASTQIDEVCMNRHKELHLFLSLY